jgi:hypothetical protein
MPSVKHLNSVCHSIAHHAVSGVSFVHPHVLAACRSAGLDRMCVNLLDNEPCPESFRDIEPLRLSLRALRSKLEGILNAEGFSMADLSFAQLTFSPASNDSDEYCSVCRAILTSTTGRTYEHVVDYLGTTRNA